MGLAGGRSGRLVRRLRWRKIRRNVCIRRLCGVVDQLAIYPFVCYFVFCTTLHAETAGLGISRSFVMYIYILTILQSSLSQPRHHIQHPPG